MKLNNIKILGCLTVTADLIFGVFISIMDSLCLYQELRRKVIEKHPIIKAAPFHGFITYSKKELSKDNTEYGSGDVSTKLILGCDYCHLNDVKYTHYEDKYKAHGIFNEALDLYNYFLQEELKLVAQYRSEQNSADF